MRKTSTVMATAIAAAIIGLCFSSPNAQAARTTVPVQAQERTEGFVKIRDGRELYVDYLKPTAGQPVAILLNGLTYRTGCWDAFVKELQGKGLGILRYDPMGHGKTMVKYGYPTSPFDYKDQVADLASLIKVLKIKNPVHLVTLSYGGAIGMQYAVEHPADVATLILMGPFVAPLEGQDQWIKTQIMQTRIMFPLNRSTDDELYDFFLKSIVYATYPSAEPIVLEHPFKLEATFRLVQGVRRFHAVDIVNDLPDGKVHLVLARQDQYVSNDVHDAFWKQVPDSKKASRLYIQGSEHKIPEAVPHFSAEWVKLIIAGDARLQTGRTFEGGPWTGTATSGRTSITIK
ncbi:MAG: alpha/beta hydrolase [Bdellovibrionaceae bacterium]|nr:alpha/beta hydrolase [Pseudobdellovibrionaceae bacterium]